MNIDNIDKIIIIVLIFVLIYCVFLYFWPINSSSEQPIEHLTSISNEAIQNLASIYNTGKIASNNIIASNSVSSENITATGQISSSTISVPSASISTITGIGSNGVSVKDNLSVLKNITVGGNLCFGNTCMTQTAFQNFVKFWNQKDYMYDNTGIKYDNIFTALTSNIIAKYGSPTGWDQTTYVSNMWNNKRMLNIGTSGGTMSTFAGISIVVPQGMNVIWIRILNDRWSNLVLADSSKNMLGMYASGYRWLNQYDPMGGPPDGYTSFHSWIPIPLSNSNGGTFGLGGGVNAPDGWISGVGFSTNPWNHATNSAVAYVWALNGGTTIPLNTNNNSNDILGQIPQNAVTTLMVPVVPSGNDKLIYLYTLNTVQDGFPHVTIFANGTQIERFKTVYINPFATHMNSKIAGRYIAARIPTSLIGSTDRFIKLNIDTTGMNASIYFREAGSHDYF